MLTLRTHSFRCTWAILATFYTFLGLRTNAVFVGIQVMCVLIQ